jgi:hypothetical protein
MRVTRFGALTEEQKPTSPSLREDRREDTAPAHDRCPRGTGRVAQRRCVCLTLLSDF